MSDILNRIAAYKRDEVAMARLQTSSATLEAEIKAQGPARGFIAALRQAAPRPALIAEIKKASPSRGLIREDFDPPSLAEAYAKGGAQCLSVLTDGPAFMGCEAYLKAARARVDLPVLRKDFLVDPWQVTESCAMGADCILIIMAMVDDSLAQDLYQSAIHLGMDVLVEAHNAQEIARALKLGAEMIGINNRDLHTFKVDVSLSLSLRPLIPDSVLLVSESGIFEPETVRQLHQGGFRAVLVGESLMRQSDVTEATRHLMAM